MDVSLFQRTTDVNGKPTVAWQEQLDQMYTNEVPFGEILSFVRHVVDSSASYVVDSSASSLVGGVSFEVAQRVVPLAAALIEAGMDVDILLERMMVL